jgi:ribosomal protein L32E
MKTIKTIYSDIDSQNRQFIWTAYEDGSALSREITRHCSDAARRTKETWRKAHAAGSDIAKMIALM